MSEPDPQWQTLRGGVYPSVFSPRRILWLELDAPDGEIIGVRYAVDLEDWRKIPMNMYAKIMPRLIRELEKRLWTPPTGVIIRTNYTA